MNLVLFTCRECDQPLPTRDPRSRHILEVLRRNIGDAFECGVVNGPRGRARLTHRDENGLHLAFEWSASPPPPLSPITLLIGLPRPQTARKIVGEATTLGVERMLFFSSEKGEKSYGDSSLWTTDEVTRLLITAAEQAFSTRLPTVTRLPDLQAGVAACASAVSRISLDNYEAPAPIGEVPLAGTPAAVAIGPERGWSTAERDILRAAGFSFAHLGARVLRTETACTAAVAILKTRLGLW